MEKIILASKSPRRSEILKAAGIPFEVVTADADETAVKSVTAAELTMGLASRKLRAVLDRTGDDRLILAADTLVCRNGEVYGKPKDAADAERMLTMLSDGWHEVYTGIAMQKAGKLVIRRCELVFHGVRYPDTLPDEIREGAPGRDEEELVWRPKSGDWHGKGRCGGYVIWGRWSYQPYLD